MTYAHYLEQVTLALLDNPTWRLGQAYFNILRLLKPGLAEEIRGSAADPFYNDKRIAVFLTRVRADWDEYDPA